MKLWHLFASFCQDSDNMRQYCLYFFIVFQCHSKQHIMQSSSLPKKTVFLASVFRTSRLDTYTGVTNNPHVPVPYQRISRYLQRTGTPGSCKKKGMKALSLEHPGYAR